MSQQRLMLIIDIDPVNRPQRLIDVKVLQRGNLQVLAVLGRGKGGRLAVEENGQTLWKPFDRQWHAELSARCRQRSTRTRSGCP